MKPLTIALLFAAAVLLAQDWGARQPRVISRSDPEFTEEARRAHVNTTVGVTFVVNEEGVPENIKVVDGAGFGLDEIAVQAVAGWRFEPGLKAGKPFQAPTRADLNFRLLDDTRAGQNARLNFSLPPDVERPVLMKGDMPLSPHASADTLLRIRLTVDARGKPGNFVTLEAQDQEWARQALETMAKWRFQPATRNAQPEEINGVFELSFHPPASNPSAATPQPPHFTEATVRITSPLPEDTSLPAPRLITPADGALFDGFPRHIACQWQASPRALSYLLEWDYMEREAWHAEEKGGPGIAFVVNGTEYTLTFIGAQPGRWRVWPVNSAGQRGNPSEWRTFRCLR